MLNLSNPFLMAARAGKNGLWRYLFTVILSLLLLLFGSTLLAGVLFAAGRGNLLTVPGWLGLAISLAPFALLILGLWIGMRMAHERPFFSLIHPGGRFRWGLWALSAGIWLGLSALGDVALALIYPNTYHFIFDAPLFWPYALVAVLLLPVQVAAEELWFRGYLTQAFGLAGGPWVAWLVPAVLFGLLHGFNPEVGAYGMLLTMPVYIGLGLLTGWVTLRTGGLEMSLGLHLANNFYATLLVTAPVSALPAPSLLRIGIYHPAASLVVTILMIVGYERITTKTQRRGEGEAFLTRS